MTAKKRSAKTGPKRPSGGQTRATPEKLAAFCAALATRGIVGRAAEAISVDRMTVYRWRAADASFAAAWDAALKIGITALEDEAHRRAFEGTDKPIVHLGKVTGHMKEYSDTLAIFLLKAHAPEKYRERAQVDVTNSDGSLQLDETARAARLAQLLAKAQERKAAEGGDEGCDLA